MVRVREAVVEDAGSMAKVNAAGWREGYRGIIPDEHLEHLPVASWRREITDGLREPRADSFSQVAELDGSFAGYCFVAAPGRDEPEGARVAELVAIYVDPLRWRRGVGRELVTAAIGEAAQRGYAELILWTFERNERALDFYRAVGFAPDGGERLFLPIGVPTVRLRRDLG